MFHLIIMLRNLSRNFTYSSINIGGLAIGLTVVLLICAFIFNEYSFDKQFTHHKRIYRANSDIKFPGMEGIMSATSVALAPAAKEEISGVEAAVRIFVFPNNPAVVKAGNDFFKVEKLCWADEDFFSFIRHTHNLWFC